MAQQPINPQHDAEIRVTLKGGHMDLAFPFDKPQLVREMFAMALFAMEQQPMAQIENAQPIPAGCVVKTEGNQMIVAAPLMDGPLCRRLLCAAIVKSVELDRQSAALAQKLWKPGGGAHLFNGR